MYAIKNWSSYQSFKDRKPSWIRLHVDIIDNYEFQHLTESSQALLPQLWALASEDADPKSGKLPPADKISFRLRKDKKKIQACLDELESSSFIKKLQICNDSVTDLLNSVTPEKRRDREETEKTGEIPEWVPLVELEAFRKMRKASKKPMTAHGEKLILADLLKLKEQGHDPKLVLEASIKNNWQGVFPLKFDKKPEKSRKGEIIV